MKPWRDILEELTPRAFRAAALVLERIERHRVSLDSAYQAVLRNVRLGPSEARVAYKLAHRSLLSIGVGKYLLERHGLGALPLRRKAAFYAASAVALAEPDSVSKLESVRGGLLGNRLLNLLKPGSLERVLEGAEELPRAKALSLRYSLPPLLVERLLQVLGEREVQRLAEAFYRRTVWLRPLRPELSGELEEYLRGLGLRYSRDRDVSYLFRLDVASEEPLPKIPPHLGIYQDKASVLVAEALARHVEEGAVLLDAAAAPCLKTQLLVVRSSPSEVLAVDISGKRLLTCRELVGPWGVLVDLLQADSRAIVLSRCADAALVDAPCTNSGAIGRDPGLRLALWDLTAEELAARSRAQRGILRRTLQNVRVHGVVAYATCSLFPEEGEDVVKEFIEDVVLFPPSPAFTSGYPRYDFADYVGRSFPHIHRADGFFVATMRRAR